MARIIHFGRIFSRYKTQYPSILNSRSSSSFQSKSLSENGSIGFGTGQRFYEAKKLSEIFRSIAILKLSSYDTIARDSLKLMNYAQKALGTRMFEKLMKKTIYHQFVAGEQYADIQETIAHLQKHGIGTMLYVPAEEDFMQDTDDFESKEAIFDRNTEALHDCIEKTAPGAFAQMRVSTLCSPSLLTPFTSLLKPYESQTEKPEGADVKNLSRVFGTDEYLLDLVPGLSANKNRHLQNSLCRMDALAKHSKDRKVRLMFDAEQTYMEGAMHQMILTLQSKYNRNTPWVYGTYQAYRKDTVDRIRSDLHLMSNEGFHFGAKLVRGAYKDMERKRAKDLGYENPIHCTYQDTCNSYNKSLKIILENVALTQAGVMVASHNEESIVLATKRMEELGIDKGEGKVSFAQIYGMADHITYLLGSKGYEIYKSVPYGPVNTTLAYLSRRASENRDVVQRTQKERSLMWKELKYRMLSTEKLEYSTLSQERK